MHLINVQILHSTENWKDSSIHVAYLQNFKG